MRRNFLPTYRLSGTLLVIGIGALLFLHWTWSANERNETLHAGMPGLGTEPFVRLHLDVKKRFLNIPAIAKFSDGKFLLADFEHIYLLNITARSITRYAPRLTRETTLEKYQPTALYYSSAQKLLYVANYLKKNVMILTVDESLASLTHVKTITHPDIISAEGIWLDEPSKILFVTNIDGNSVTAFDLTDLKHARHLWTTRLAKAHGVCVYRGRVYVTGLAGRQIHELSVETGEVLRTYGHLGWDADNGGFLWPTGIVPDNRGNLVISDPETGFISTFDIERWRVTGARGGNGPGRYFLNQPYMTMVDGDQFLTISTKQERLVIGDYPSWAVHKSLIRDRPFWENFSAHNDQLRLGGKGWDGYTWTVGPRVSLGGRKYMIWSSFLLAEKRQDPAAFTTIQVGNVPTPFGYNNYKQLQLFEKDGLVILSSPQSHSGPTVIKQEHDLIWAIRFIGQNDCWLIVDEIQCPDGPLDLKGCIKRAEEWRTQMELSRCPDGVVPYRTSLELLMRFRQADGIDHEVDSVRNDFKATFRSPRGQRFFEVYSKITDCSSPLGDLKQLRSDLLSNKDRIREISLDELSFISILVH